MLQRMRYCLNYSGTRILSIEIKITGTQFPGEFRLKTNACPVTCKWGEMNSRQGNKMGLVWGWLKSQEQVTL